MKCTPDSCPLHPKHLNSKYHSLMVKHRRRQWHPTPVLLPGKSHGRRSLVGWSPWGREESDTTERLHFHFSLSCIGEGNGNPLQCSCLEIPRTWLKRLSSNSSRQLWCRDLNSGISGSKAIAFIHSALQGKGKWEQEEPTFCGWS